MKQKKDSIVVIGLGCVYSGAHSPEELWQNVLASRRFFRVAPDVRLPKKYYFDRDKFAPGKTYCDKMAVITDWEFDPVEFHIPPVSAYTSDIAHWLALYTAREAIKDSGIDLEKIDCSRVGVIIGNTLTGEFSRSHNLMFRWPYVERAMRRALAGNDKKSAESLIKKVEKIYKAPLPEITEDSLPGNMSNTIAGRICNYFNFGGGGYTIDGACSSSLLSIAHACTALEDGDMDVAVAGGVDISLDPFEVIGFAKTTALAQDDIRPYDEHAEGLLPGEGCGIILLAKESFAKKIGAKIHAKITGWGYSSDGSAGITAPEAEGQMRALKKAYDRAGYSIADVQLIEGHGTGTPLGDKVEINALMRMLDASAPAEKSAAAPRKIGSIKSNIGHCKAAAGAAAFIKAVMAVERKIIPPTTNCRKPNASFGAPPKKLVPAFTGCEWRAGNSPRRAAVSAMGFGGANSHVTIEEANPKAKPKKEELALLRSARATELIFLSASSEKELAEKIEKLLPVARKICRAELTDLAAELSAREQNGEIRLALVTDSPWDLTDKFSQILSQLNSGASIEKCDDSASGIFAGKAKANPKFVALFPGQGSQRINMCRDFAAAFPFVEKMYDTLGKNIRDKIFRDTITADNDTLKSYEEELKQTGNSQPAIVLTSLVVLKILKYFGLSPDVVLGHSLGEIAAFAAAGAYDEKTAMDIAVARGKAMSSAKSEVPGGMLAIAAPADTVEKLLENYKGKINIANYNSPTQTVVTGALDSIDALAADCKTQEIRHTKLRVSNAFHSKLVQPAANELRKKLDKFSFKKISKKIISTSTATHLSGNENLKDLLAEQITAPVKFISSIELAAKENPDFYVEVGPGGVLSGLTRATLGFDNAECFPADLKDENSLTLLDKILARAFSVGLPVATDKIFADRFSKPIDIENYNPVFIVNPCERPVEIPDSIDENLDMQSTKNVDGSSSEDAVSFAIDWIAKRTGFPKSSIAPEMKLRDDLNLDSIKVGELVFMICKKLNKKSPADPSAFANARLDKLISIIQKDFKSDDAATDDSTDVATQSPADISGIENWIGTFQIEKISMPLSNETYLPFPKIGSALILGDEKDDRVIAVKNRFERKGLNPVVASPDSLSHLSKPATDFSILVLILPEENPDFSNLSENDFDAQLKKISLSLFNSFKWIGNGRDASWKHLRALVARPCANPKSTDDSADAGKAFLKTLRLEHSAVQAKWLALPAEWSADQWANIIEKEIQTTGSRVFYKFDADGARFTDAAKKLALDNNGALKLGENDVLFATGGSKGITFEMARALAKKTGAKLLLTGRTPLPGNDEMKKHFKILDEEGIAYKYISCDVTDLAQMKKAVAETEKSLGKISAILHGAGVSKLNLLENMPEDDFLKTIFIKARGMFNLIKPVPLKNLKSFHVISSVLGKTGMRGQTDYTFANAWLDGALAQIKSDFPKIHCASLGYSVWADAGLGKKLGVVDSLENSGVHAMSTKEGVDAYLKICSGESETTTFIITGRLGAQLENDIFAPPSSPLPRFATNIIRRAPGVELISEITVNRATDLFLAEHIFEGTTMFPGVMMIEAMAQAAALCLECENISAVKNIEFLKPIIVPDNDSLTIRIYALAISENMVKTAIRTESDGFFSDNVVAEFIFDNTQKPADDIPEFVEIKEKLDINPETLFPSPLFQGKLFRRISEIKKRDELKESITEINFPSGEKYFSDKFSDKIITRSPAARDAFLQSGLLILPLGSLPEKIGEINFYTPPKQDEKLTCRVIVKEQNDDHIVSDLAVYNSAGKLSETIKNVITKTPDKSGGKTIPPRVAKPIPIKRIVEDLNVLISEKKWSAAFAEHSEISSGELSEISQQEISSLSKKIPAPRKNSAIANIIAARRAAIAFAKKFGKDILSENIALVHNENGKPYLSISPTVSAKNIFDDCDISIADCGNLSFAFIGKVPAGIDVEQVETRNAETWRALLGHDGYNLALLLTEQTSETFDISATRVWTLIEAAKKANNLKRILPRFNSSLGDPWLLFSYATAQGEQEFYCSTIENGDDFPLVFTVSFGARKSDFSNFESASPIEKFDFLINDFAEKMEQFKPLFANDPASPDTEEHHKQFCAVIENLLNQLVKIEQQVDSGEIYKMRKKLIERLTPFLDGSDVFRHAIEKPYGYAGDFLMLDKLVQETSQSKGLAYHFDRSQLEYPASVACRNRIKWVAEDIVKTINPSEKSLIKILDIGIGAAPIERRLVKLIPDVKIKLTAVDIEPAALEYVEKELENTNCVAETHRIDLRREDAAEKIAAFAKDADVCIAVGIIEALRDEEVINILGAIIKNAKPGTPFYTESFNPQHPTRPHMEWFMDFHLGYRTAQQVIELVKKAGAKQENMKPSTDETGSLDFLKVII